MNIRNFLKTPRVMGILNVTPDSFSDGGKFFPPNHAVKRAEEMIKEGADIIDIGGEATGPGSKEVSTEEELRRIISVVERVAKLKVVVSVDTSKAEVAEQAIKAGAQIINDVSALRGDPKMAQVIVGSGAAIVLMFSHTETGRATREAKKYNDIMATVRAFLVKRIAEAQKAGIKDEQIILDPGMGCFVSAEPFYSFEIIRRLDEMTSMSFPVLVGPSRKSFLGGPEDKRDEKSLAVSTLALVHGASIIRTHDVAATKRIVEIAPHLRGLVPKS